MTAALPTFRKAGQSDAVALTAFAERTFRDTYGEFNTAENMDRYVAGAFAESVQLAEIDDPRMTFVLAEVEGTLAGYAQLSTRKTDSGTHVEIDRFYIDTAWHGRGLARQLMAHVVAMASAAGAHEIVLGVWQENQRAIAFYAKAGFAVTRRATFLLGDDLQFDWIMTRPLERP